MGEHAPRLVTSKEKECSAHVYQAIQDFVVKQVGYKINYDLSTASQTGSRESKLITYMGLVFMIIPFELFLGNGAQFSSG